MGEETLDRIKEQLSERVRGLMEEREWSLSELARQAELPKSLISEILNNGSNMTISTLSKLEEAFGTPLIRVTRTRSPKKPED